ncbi:alg2, partial [Symbiodinium microadriaticum]
LLSQRTSLLKSLYRLPFDIVEELTTLLADRIVVNSNFTAGVFAKTFRLACGSKPGVLYPCVRLDDTLELGVAAWGGSAGLAPIAACSAAGIVFAPRLAPLWRRARAPRRGPFVLRVRSPPCGVCRARAPVSRSSAPRAARPVVLSINRFERKKGLRLAIDAFASMRATAARESRAHDAVLVMAGGYDPRLSENIEHHRELWARCEELGLTPANADDGYVAHCKAEASRRAPRADVLFVRSFSDADKSAMLRDCSLVVYTPRGEHFGIVPLEAMAWYRPVLAIDDAGPRETVLHEATGFLEDGSADSFAARMSQVLNSPDAVERLGRAARERVSSTFTLGAMRRELGRLVVELKSVPPTRWLPSWLLWATLWGAFVLWARLASSS